MTERCKREIQKLEGIISSRNLTTNKSVCVENVMKPYFEKAGYNLLSIKHTPQYEYIRDVFNDNSVIKPVEYGEILEDLIIRSSDGDRNRAVRRVMDKLLGS